MNEHTHAQRQALARGIREPNTSGQGTHAEAEAVPYRWRLERAGYVYSHTTGIVVDQTGDQLEPFVTDAGPVLACVHDVRTDELHHTFRRGDHTVTFWRDTRGAGRYYRGCWRWSAAWGGSGRAVFGIVDAAQGPAPLLRYLAGVRRRAMGQNRAGFRPV